MKIFKTVHKSGEHYAILDGGAWSIGPHETEIGLVRELAECGFRVSDRTCVLTETTGDTLTHTWVRG